MQSIAVVCCGLSFAALSPQAWAQACYRVWPRRHRSPWRRVSEGTPTISSKNLKPWLPGRRLGPFAILGVIIIVGGVAAGSAGGTEDVATVDGDGGDDH